MNLTLSSPRSLSMSVLAVVALGVSWAVVSSTGCRDCHYTSASTACLPVPVDPVSGSMLTCPSRAEALDLFSPPDGAPPDVVSVESEATFTGKECCYDVIVQHYCD